MSFGDCHQNSEENKGENTVLTHGFILCHAGEFDVESIQSLTLVNCGIFELSPLEECVNLSRLNLSGNNITNIRPLCYIKALVVLNLSDNKISNIDPLSQLENLSDLNLAGNLICSYERLKPLKQLENFEKFRLHDVVKELTNPLCTADNYITTILAMFPKLIVIDGDRVKGRGKELFQICQELDDQLKNKRTFGPVEQRPMPGKWLSDDFFKMKEPRNKIDDSIDNARKVIMDKRDLDSKARELMESVRGEADIN